MKFNMIDNTLYKPIKNLNIGDKFLVEWAVDEEGLPHGLKYACNMTVDAKDYITLEDEDDDEIKALQIKASNDRGYREYILKGDSCCEGAGGVWLYSFSMPSFSELTKGDYVTFQCYDSDSLSNLEVVKTTRVKGYVKLKLKGDISNNMFCCENVNETMKTELEIYVHKDCVTTSRLFNGQAFILTALKR